MRAIDLILILDFVFLCFTMSFRGDMGSVGFMWVFRLMHFSSGIQSACTSNGMGVRGWTMWSNAGRSMGIMCRWGMFRYVPLLILIMGHVRGMFMMDDMYRY